MQVMPCCAVKALIEAGTDLPEQYLEKAMNLALTNKRGDIIDLINRRTINTNNPTFLPSIGTGNNTGDNSLRPLNGIDN